MTLKLCAIQEGYIMELRVLRYFLAAAMEESITAAAARMHVTQPTLSKQLKDLENELGRQLFIRGNRKITLTQEGMFLRKRAQEIIDLADRTERTIQNAGTELSGDVFIGSGETYHMHLFAKVIRKMHEKCPKVKFHFYSANGTDIKERIDRGLLDFGLLIGHVDLSKYEYITLPAKDIWGLLLRKDQPLARKKHITPADMRCVSLLCSRQETIQNELTGWLGYSFDELNVIGTFNLIYNAAMLVENGMGCALTLKNLVREGDGKPLCFRPFYPELSAELNIIWKKGQLFSPAAQQLLQDLQREIMTDRTK